MSDISNSSIRDPYWLRGFYLGFGAFIVLSGVFMMAVGYFAEPRLWIVVLCGLVLVSFSVLAGRAAANGVSFEGDRVTVRTGFRTRSFERSEVAGFFRLQGLGRDLGSVFVCTAVKRLRLQWTCLLHARQTFTR